VHNFDHGRHSKVQTIPVIIVNARRDSIGS
jgi:hypothetical protein